MANQNYPMGGGGYINQRDIKPLTPSWEGNFQMPPAVQDPAVDPSTYRHTGEKKGPGFLGSLPYQGGGTSTEISVGTNIGGKEMEIPSLVPTLSPKEIAHLLGGGKPTDEIMRKAVEHARMRMGQGLSVFKE